MADPKQTIIAKLKKLRKDLEQGTGKDASKAQVNLGFVLNDVGQALGLTIPERHEVIGPSIPEKEL